MKILNAKVVDRNFTLIDPPSFTSWTNVDTLQVEFDDEWKDCDKIACFEQGDKYQTVDMVGDSCSIPAFPLDGPVRIGIVGEDGISRITTTIDRICIRPSLYKSDGKDPDNPGTVDDTEFWARIQKELDKKQDLIEEISVYELDEMLL